jgi:UDP-N-acetylmuramoyl-L-alanyl-D-glutamate--2,6-diaminopimelate ligase
LLTYGIKAEADLKASNIDLSPQGTRFEVIWRGKKIPFLCPLIGRFNVYNCLAAISVGLMRNVPLDEIAEVMRQAPFVRGRLQPVPNPLNLKIYIDFAHTDDALVNVLETLREFKTGRIITVFGCGGDRDTSKRPKMACVCEDLSDLSIVTSDNPRTEDPEEIIRQIVHGFKRKDSYLVEVDRSKAIEKAIAMANTDDLILIAGKGHENYQIFAHKTIEFDDVKMALQACQKIAEERNHA